MGRHRRPVAIRRARTRTLRAAAAVGVLGTLAFAFQSSPGEPSTSAKSDANARLDGSPDPSDALGGDRVHERGPGDGSRASGDGPVSDERSGGRGRVPADDGPGAPDGAHRDSGVHVSGASTGPRPDQGGGSERFDRDGHASDNDDGDGSSAAPGRGSPQAPSVDRPSPPGTDPGTPQQGGGDGGGGSGDGGGSNGGDDGGRGQGPLGTALGAVGDVVGTLVGGLGNLLGGGR